MAVSVLVLALGCSKLGVEGAKKVFFSPTVCILLSSAAAQELILPN